MPTAATSQTTHPVPQWNRVVVAKLRETADLLALQNANPFRVNAYRHAADTIEQMRGDVRQLAETAGEAGLTALPDIGPAIASALVEIVATGRWSRLDRLRGELEPEKLLQLVPGIGPSLAARIHDTLHIDSLEALEMAAHDGRLAALPGVGARRNAALQASIAMLLRRTSVRTRTAAASPSVDTLLDVDREYRRKVAEARLPTIAPRRFNPRGEAWLPVLHTERGAWHFTALFSNTARAHQAGRTRDWVVLYYYDHTDREDQCTIVTETHGALRGERVVRGRERDCRDYYARNPVSRS